MIRERLWRCATAKLPPGQMLPRWAILLRWALFPLDSLYWRLTSQRGYQWMANSWMIGGLNWSDDELVKAAHRPGLYLITKQGDTVSLTPVKINGEQRYDIHR